MKFTAPEGKQVIFNGRIITAKDGGFETEDKAFIDVLRNARDVTEIKSQTKPATKKAD
jgi:hypothetical protein